MSRRFVRVMCIIIAVLILFGIFFSVLGSMSAYAVSQSEIDALEEERDAIRNKQADVQEQLDSLQADMTFILDKKAVLDEQNELNRQDIEIINQQIELYDELIDEKAKQVEEAIALEEEQYRRFCERLRAMEENGNWSYISFVFKANSFSDLLSRLDDVMDIVTRDQELEKQYIEAREQVQLIKAEYEAVQAEQEKKKEELLKQKEELEEQIKAAYEMIAALEEDIEEYKVFYEENEKLEAEIQAKIDEKVEELRKQEEARKAAEAAAAAANRPTNNASSVPKTSGSYYWPCQSSTYITSKFGYRVHPIFGTTKYHYGVDVAANSGSTVSAIASGTVSIAEYSSSYGYYVVIYHNDGTTSLYAHLSSMAVSAGDSVSQGQTIGYVGSTGNSTGPHLHFEIRINGSCVDPLPYFSNLSFSYASDA